MGSRERKPGEVLCFPILFRPEMLRATLDGKKTMTRRIAQLTLDGDGISTGQHEPDATKGWGRARAGDRIWVRETLRLRDPGKRDEAWTYALDGAEVQLPADDPRVPAMLSWAHHKEGSTCVSIHMPRWACRYELVVTAKRAERLQDIIEENIRAEGFSVDLAHEMVGVAVKPRCTLREAWALGWNWINGSRATWEENPWVWVISYELAKGGGDARR